MLKQKPTKICFHTRLVVVVIVVGNDGLNYINVTYFYYYNASDYIMSTIMASARVACILLLRHPFLQPPLGSAATLSHSKIKIFRWD